jgi:hypothetical protein
MLPGVLCFILALLPEKYSTSKEEPEGARYELRQLPW